MPWMKSEVWDYPNEGIIKTTRLKAHPGFIVQTDRGIIESNGNMYGAYQCYDAWFHREYDLQRADTAGIRFA